MRASGPTLEERRGSPPRPPPLWGPGALFVVNGRRRGGAARSEQAASFDARLTGARVAVSRADAHVRRQAGNAVGTQKPLVYVALGHEQDLVSGRVLPVHRVLARVGATRAQDEVGATRALARTGAVTTDEHDERQHLCARAVTRCVHRPAGQEVLVALELRGAASDRQTIVVLDHHISGGGLAVLGCRDLDDPIGSDRLEAIDLDGPAVWVLAQEVVRRASAGQTQVARGQRDATVRTRAGRGRERRFSRAAEPRVLTVQRLRERQRPAGDVDLAQRPAQDRPVRIGAGSTRETRGAGARDHLPERWVAETVGLQRLRTGRGDRVAHRYPAAAAPR